jgi:POT family proton-dependent oligopeptide transporter
MAVYFTPVIGGLLADRYLGYRWAVILGALAMTLDMHHGSRDAFVLYNWILMVGNGLFKPNMTSIISYAYEKHPEKKMELILFIIWV